MANSNIDLEGWRREIIPDVIGASLGEVVGEEACDFGTKPRFLKYMNEKAMVQRWEELGNVECEGTSRSSF